MKCERVIKKPQKDEKLAKIFPVYSIFILDNNEIILSSVLLKERSRVIRAASLINKNVLRATQLSQVVEKLFKNITTARDLFLAKTGWPIVPSSRFVRRVASRRVGLSIRTRSALTRVDVLLGVNRLLTLPCLLNLPGSYVDRFVRYVRDTCHAQIDRFVSGVLFQTLGRSSQISYPRRYRCLSVKLIESFCRFRLINRNYPTCLVFRETVINIFGNFRRVSNTVSRVARDALVISVNRIQRSARDSTKGVGSLLTCVNTQLSIILDSLKFPMIRHQRNY